MTTNVRLTRDVLIHVAVGAAITAVVTLGAALVTIGPTTDLEAWARNLLIAEAGAVGGFLVDKLRGDPPPAEEEPTGGAEPAA